MSTPPPRLGKVQLQIMQVLWDSDAATARHITEELERRGTPLAHSTVQTLLRKMEAKGAVTHDASERTWVFRASFQKTEVNRSVASDLVNRVFNGSVYGLVAHLFKHEDISEEEMNRLRTLLEESEGRRHRAPVTDDEEEEED